MDLKFYQAGKLKIKVLLSFKIFLIYLFFVRYYESSNNFVQPDPLIHNA